MRRDSKDLEWKKTREQVFRRDNNKCRLLRVLTLSEARELFKNASNMINILDPAHIIPVSSRPDLCYEPLDICTLNRYSHECLDSCRNPVNGKHITREERDNWWLRITDINEEQKTFLKKEGFPLE